MLNFKINHFIFILSFIGYSLSSKAQSAWSLTGNSGTNPTTNWLGTSDNQRMVFKQNNIEKMTITDNGIGIGMTNPAYTVDVNGVLHSSIYCLGSDFSILPVANGQSVVASFWGLQLIGNRQQGVLFSPTDYGSREDYGVMIPSQQATKVALAVIGKVGQSGDLTQWRSTGDSIVSRVSSTGTFYTKKLKVTNSPWADYVFDKSYRLPTLNELDQFIKANHHLPDLPSAEEVEKDGVDVGDTQALLLKKIEELSLYAISQEKRMQAQALEMKSLRKQLAARIKR